MDDTVTVLGAGIVGICTALSLAERGVKVRVIDRAEPGQATSYGNAGVISPWSVVPQSLPGTWRQIPKLMLGSARPLSVRLAAWPKMIPWGLRFVRGGTPEHARAASHLMETLCGPCIELYKRHLCGTGAEHLLKDSMYVHAFRDGTRANLDGLDYTIRREKGANIELIGFDALRRTEPALSPEFKAAILIQGQARATSPGRIGAALAEKAHRLGVVFLTDNIRRLERTRRSWRITCDAQTYDSPRLVLAMGAWSDAILKHIGIHVPLMAERGYHVEFHKPGVELSNSVMDVDAKLVASSMETGLRVAGQAEFAPVDTPPNPKKRSLIQRLAKNALPDLNIEPDSFWMGQRPSFPDSLPVLGAVPGETGLFVNFGHSHYGLMMAPKSGEIIADLLSGRMPNREITGFSITRMV